MIKNDEIKNILLLMVNNFVKVVVNIKILTFLMDLNNANHAEIPDYKKEKTIFLFFKIKVN